MDTEIKANFFIGVLFVILAVLALGIGFAACYEVEELPAPGYGDMAVSVDGGYDLSVALPANYRYFE